MIYPHELEGRTHDIAPKKDLPHLVAGTVEYDASVHSLAEAGGDFERFASLTDEFVEHLDEIDDSFANACYLIDNDFSQEEVNSHLEASRHNIDRLEEVLERLEAVEAPATEIGLYLALDYVNEIDKGYRSIRELNQKPKPASSD
jgi:DNA-binding SARP family transcriptional activator